MFGILILWMVVLERLPSSLIAVPMLDLRVNYQVAPHPLYGCPNAITIISPSLPGGRNFLSGGRGGGNKKGPERQIINIHIHTDRYRYLIFEIF